MQYLRALLIGALLCWVPSTTLAQKKPKKVNCHRDLKKAVEFINDNWSFKLFKPGYVDLEQVFQELEPEARRATDPEACADLLARFMARLGDGHSSLHYFPGLERTRPRIEVRSQREQYTRIPGQRPPVHAYVVSRDTTDETLRAIAPGSEIVAVDGASVDSLYQFWGHRVSGSTRQWIDYMCDLRLLTGPPDTEVELSLREPGGASRTVLVRRPPYLSEDEQEREADIYRDTAKIATWERLDGGWGYLKFRDFHFDSYETTVRLFDEALDSLLDAPGLILDLRGNGGGTVGAMVDAVGRFANEKVVVEFLQVRESGQHLVIEFWDPKTGGTTSPPVIAEPRKEIYTGPLVALIDRRCFSACEGFTAGLQSTGRALVVGQTSGGGSGWVSAMKLPSGAVISFSWTVAWRPDGQQIEGNGVVPDIRVRERPRDWAVGRDRVLERAIRALEQGEAKPLADTGQGD